MAKTRKKKSYTPAQRHAIRTARGESPKQKSRKNKKKGKR